VKSTIGRGYPIAGCGVEGLLSEIDDDCVLRNRTPPAVAAGSLRIVTGG